MKKTTESKDLNYYLTLPWTYTIETEAQKDCIYYIIRVNELPGICTDSESLDDGMNDIKKLITCAIEIYKEKGIDVPEPITKDHYKGNIFYRTNSERHFRIARTAQIKHKSISKTLDMIVDKGLECLTSV